MNSTSLNRKMVTTGLLGVVLLLILIPASRKTVFERHLFRAIDSTAIRFVDLIVVFVLNTIVLPLIFLGGCSIWGGCCSGAPFRIKASALHRCRGLLVFGH